MQVSAHLLRTFRNALAIVAVAGAFLGACGGDTSTTDPMDDITIPTFPVSDIIWGECTGDDAPEEPFECATFEVPLDHMVPGDETVSLALVRLPADGTVAERQSIP